MDHVLAWSTAFVWTLGFELPVYAVLLHACFRAWWTAPALALAVNLVTHPAFSWWVFAADPSDMEVAGAEVLIAATEGLLVATVLRARSTAARPVVRGVLAGIVANGISYGAGRLLFGG